MRLNKNAKKFIFIKKPLQQLPSIKKNLTKLIVKVTVKIIELFRKKN